MTTEATIITIYATLFIYYPLLENIIYYKYTLSGPTEYNSGDQLPSPTSKYWNASKGKSCA
jgi:hypothetical protein